MDPFPITLQHLQDFCFISLYTKLGCKYLSETSTFSTTSSDTLLIEIVRKSLKKVTLFLGKNYSSVVCFWNIEIFSRF